ncbi:hypothetical protein HZA39_01795 [Candidatus Peregrinibacteria bacterium]|nr:hypothetical protein [Candidatus Peregrinibacteria bacterium]
MREIHIKDDSSKRRKAESVSKKIEIIEEEPEAENEFEVQPLEEKQAAAVSLEADAKDYVKVKFGNFVQLIANHDFRSVIERHLEEDIIMKTNLLTDLANAHSEEQKKGSSWPIIFAVGIVLGIIAAYVLFKFF